MNLNFKDIILIFWFLGNNDTYNLVLQILFRNIIAGSTKGNIVLSSYLSY